MKKRNKIIAFGVSSLAVLSVCTVGFATWLVGVQKSSEDVKVTATVDDTTNQSVFLSAKIAKGIKLAEAAGTGSDDGGDYKIIEATQGEINTAHEDYLGFTFSELKLTMSEDDFVGKPDAIKISLPVYSAGTVELNKGNTVTTNEFSEDGKREGSSWTYVSFTDVTLDLTAENFTITDSKTDGFKEYTIIGGKNDFTFAWGTFFDKDTLEDKSPVNFYNSLYTDADFEEGGSHSGEDKFGVLLKASQKATKELEAMKKNLKELTLKVEAIKKASE